MTKGRLANLFAAAAIALAFAAGVLAHDFDVYRGVPGRTNRGCVTGPKITGSEFTIGPDGLSTFEAGYPLDSQKAYRLLFRVTGVPHDPPHPGDQGSVVNVNGHDYTATYTPEHGEGHWSLKEPNLSTQAMKADFVAYGDAGHTSRNPTYNGATRYCDTAPRRERLPKE
jgi:hypothetical protein